jgi:hypothetical protein
MLQYSCVHMKGEKRLVYIIYMHTDVGILSRPIESSLEKMIKMKSLAFLVLSCTCLYFAETIWCVSCCALGLKERKKD